MTRDPINRRVVKRPNTAMSYLIRHQLSVLHHIDEEIEVIQDLYEELYHIICVKAPDPTIDYEKMVDNFEFATGLLESLHAARQKIADVIPDQYKYLV